MENKSAEIANFIVKKCLIAILVIAGVTFGAVHIGFTLPDNKNIVALYKDAFDLKSQNEATANNIKNLQEKLKKMQNEQKTEKVQEEKVPVVLYKPVRQNAPIESSAVDLVTEVIKTLERTHNTIVDISYSIVETPPANMPSNISIVKLNMTLNSSYVAFQDFLFDLYDDEYISTVKTTKMVPLQENKSLLEINTEIWLYISK